MWVKEGCYHLNCISSKFIYQSTDFRMHYSVLSQNVTLFGDRIFTELMFYDRPYSNMTNVPIRKRNLGTSLVAQQLRICLPVQETQVQFLVRELRFPHSVEQLSLHATCEDSVKPKKKEREREKEKFKHRQTHRESNLENAI